MNHNNHDHSKCPACQREVEVVGSEDGTRYYMPVEDDEGIYCAVCSGGMVPPEDAA